eukprot:gnl/TRDRNA2_/TRDRNA2_152234_c0_seq1.p1 gnl/TRDRNA2_/TRDRNA2_152234_c0~~gnl/TRDRNA2_/TRDRNA2_152234_c0_seq1.p1  ORF type:complete len:560 (+),score=83.08 gnl/TRDRNA2_/TRDRNA2_152234_c0_seq1:2-1681(+)
MLDEGAGAARSSLDEESSPLARNERGRPPPLLVECSEDLAAPLPVDECESANSSPLVRTKAHTSGSMVRQQVSSPRLQSPMSAFFNPEPPLQYGRWSTMVTKAGERPSLSDISIPAELLATKPLIEASAAIEGVSPLPEDPAMDDGLGSSESWELPTHYQLGQLLGCGAYGSVREAWDCTKQRRVAVKRIEHVFQDSVHSRRILREIAILSHLKHKHVVQIYDLLDPSIENGCDVLYIFMERCDTDLRKVCNNLRGVSLAQARQLAYGLFVGCSYIHSAGVYHRDLKPANCLVNRIDCCVKICDFNLSRTVDPLALGDSSDDLSPFSRDEADASGECITPLGRTLTRHVASRWYRPPEVILQLRYSEAMDVWSAGCIVAELFFALNEGGRRPKRGALFPGRKSDLLSSVDSYDSEEDEQDRSGDQLDVIFEVLGTPSKTEMEHIPSHAAYKRVQEYPPRPGHGLRWRLPPEACESGLDLLERMLQLLPGNRITMAEALRHPFFDSVHKKADEEEAAFAPGQLDIGFDEAELDGTVTAVPRWLRHEIGRFNPPESAVAQA